jgi:hypothetical protein
MEFANVSSFCRSNNRVQKAYVFSTTGTTFSLQAATFLDCVIVTPPSDFCPATGYSEEAFAWFTSDLPIKYHATATK